MRARGRGGARRERARETKHRREVTPHARARTRGDRARRRRAMARATTPLMFEPPCSAPDSGFWREAARVKLHEAKLDESPIDVRARVCCAQNAEVSSAVSLDALAFDDGDARGRGRRREDEGRGRRAGG